MAKTAELLIGSTEKDENLYYATGFLAPDDFTLLIVDGRKVVLMAELEYERAKRTATVDEVVLASDLALKPGYQDPSVYGPACLPTVMQLLKEYGVGSVTVPASFPLEAADYLRERQITCKSRQNQEGLFFPDRMVKDAKELAAILTTQQIIEEVFLLAREEIARSSIRDDGVLIRPDGMILSVEYLRRMMHREFAARDCEARHTIIAVGDQAVDPHEEGFGPLRAYTWIIFDIFPRGPQRYFSDTTRTVAKGRPPSERVKMFQSVYRWQCRGIERIREGVDGSSIHHEILEGLAADGFATGRIEGIVQGFFHGTGHGVGLDIHEPPRINKTKGQILRAGHVVTVEPGLYYRGRGGVRIEDTVVVERDGCRNLCTLQKDMQWAIID